MKKKILITRKLTQAVEVRACRDYDATLNNDDHIFSDTELLELAEDMDALIIAGPTRLTRDITMALPDRVKAVATFSVGYDHIDLEAARERGLRVGNTPEVLDVATAETALLCLLGAARHAQVWLDMIRGQNWTGWDAVSNLGTDLGGKVTAIIGMGRIGRIFARRLQGFNMEVRYHNRKKLPTHEEEGAVYWRDLDQMLQGADVVSIHCPLTPETRHILGRERILALKPGAVVVNTARGPVVDEDTLIEALHAGHLAGVGLDVFEGEPSIRKAWFNAPRAFLLPHIGSATLEARDGMGFRCLDNLDAFFAGKEMISPLV